MKKFLIILLSLLLIGCGKKEVVFSNGLIELHLPANENFEEFEDDSGDLCLYSDNVAIAASFETKQMIKDFGYGELNLDQYCDIAVNMLGDDCSEVMAYDDFRYFSFPGKDDNVKTMYYVCILETKDSFWTINYIVVDEYKDQYLDKILDWTTKIVRK